MMPLNNALLWFFFSEVNLSKSFRENLFVRADIFSYYESSFQSNMYIIMNMERLVCFVFFCINIILRSLKGFLDISGYEGYFISPATILLCV